jgi:hypothetical protein
MREAPVVVARTSTRLSYTMGVFINDIAPEQAAEVLRGAR